MPIVLMAAAALAQTPPAKPADGAAPPAQQVPPDVDAALRARVDQFYQLEVQGKFNQALQYVAADTKDLFVQMSKPNYTSASTRSIQYNESFTEASVIEMVTRMLPIEGFMGHPLLAKIGSRWKIENGEWCFYVDPKRDMPNAPFGPLAGMNGSLPRGVMPGQAPPPGFSAPQGPSGGSSGTPRPLPPMPANLPNPRTLLADKQEVKLKASGPSMGRVVISNPSPWSAVIGFSGPQMPGFSIKLDPLKIEQGQKATLTIESAGGAQMPKMPITILVRVRTTNQTIPIKVTFED